MHTLLITIHVFAMITSLSVMGSAIITGLSGRAVAAKLASWSMLLTFIGSSTGVVLLLQAPLTMRCALLTVYVIAMASLFVFGFSKGSAEQARFIRRSTSIQKS